MNNNQSIINVVKKQLNDFGQDIEFSHNLTTQGYFKCKALMTFSRQKYQNEEMKICISDMYKFVTLEKPKIKEFIYWHGGVYKITSIDNSVQGIYKNICEYVQDYSYKYELSILQADAGTIEIGSTLQLTPSLKVDGVAVDLNLYNFIWNVINEEVATIDQNGLLTGLKEGNTTVTLTLKENLNVSASYTLTVTEKEVILSLVGNHKITKLYGYYDYVISDGRTNVTFIVESDNISDIDGNFIVNTSGGTLSIHPMVSKIEGTFNIIVKDDNSGKVLLTDKLYVDLNEYSFSILNTENEIYVNNDLQLKTYLSKNSTEITSPKIKYISGNNDLATVDTNGLIKGISVGEVIITAIAEDYNLSDTYNINIVEKPVSNTFKITNTETDYCMGDSFQITTKLMVNGEEVIKPKIKYSSNNNNLATVGTNGKVDCEGRGEVTITATATDYNLSDTLTFNIDY